jgi:DNA-binding GntR family transcriptional regulator
MVDHEVSQPLVRTPPEIADALRGMIREGRFRPGDRLGTAALAAEFGVSRGPVREALRLLESRNLVQVERHRGAFVVDIEDHEILDTLRIREVLFALLAERCALEASDDAIAGISRSVDQLAGMFRDPAVTPQRFQRATFGVIHTMFEAVGRGRLSAMIADLTEGAGDTYGHLSMATRDMRAVELKAYRTLLKAIADRDGPRAFAAARRMHERGVERARELQALTGRR